MLQTGATQYHVHVELPDKGRAIKGLIDCKLNGLALSYYQPSPEVLIVSYIPEDKDTERIKNYNLKVTQKIFSYFYANSGM